MARKWRSAPTAWKPLSASTARKQSSTSKKKIPKIKIHMLPSAVWEDCFQITWTVLHWCPPEAGNKKYTYIHWRTLASSRCPRCYAVSTLVEPPETALLLSRLLLLASGRLLLAAMLELTAMSALVDLACGGINVALRAGAIDSSVEKQGNLVTYWYQWQLCGQTRDARSLLISTNGSTVNRQENQIMYLY